MAEEKAAARNRQLVNAPSLMAAKVEADARIAAAQPTPPRPRESSQETLRPVAPSVIAKDAGMEAPPASSPPPAHVEAPAVPNQISKVVVSPSAPVASAAPTLSPTPAPAADPPKAAVPAPLAPVLALPDKEAPSVQARTGALPPPPVDPDSFARALTEPVALPELPSESRVAIYGAMIALASADGGAVAASWRVALEGIDQEGLAPAAATELLDLLIDSPRLGRTLDLLTQADGETRCAAMAAVIDVALAEGEPSRASQDALALARIRLGFSERQATELQAARSAVRAQCAAGVPTLPALLPWQQGLCGAVAVLVPLVLAYLVGPSGSFGARLDSGVLALGLGFGPVPSLMVVGILGWISFVGVRTLLQGPQRRRTGALLSARARRAAQLDTNLGTAIGEITTRLATVRDSEEAGRSKKETLKRWNQRLRVFESLRAPPPGG